MAWSGNPPAQDPSQSGFPRDLSAGHGHALNFKQWAPHDLSSQAKSYYDRWLAAMLQPED